LSGGRRSSNVNDGHERWGSVKGIGRGSPSQRKKSAGGSLSQYRNINAIPAFFAGQNPAAWCCVADA
jgi:hypothetical protein